jgi:hypothetical protein
LPAVAGPLNDDRSMTLWTALRRDPGHVSELAVLYALPELSPHVKSWWPTWSQLHPDESPEQLSRRVLRESVHVAYRGGVIAGSSFYVGMVPAVAMIYLEQVLVVLRIAAIYGRDPGASERCAEILVFQGNYPSTSGATAALGHAVTGEKSERSSERTTGLAGAVRQVPSMIGLQMRKLKTPLDVLIAVTEVVAFFVPVVSIPVWAVANARATRRLGQAAINFYSQPPTADTGVVTITLPDPITPRTRRRLGWAFLPLVGGLAVLAAFLPLGRLGHRLPWGGLGLAELALVSTFVRLMQTTAPIRLRRPRRRPE